jgi:hypothetical protein
MSELLVYVFFLDLGIIQLGEKHGKKAFWRLPGVLQLNSYDWQTTLLGRNEASDQMIQGFPFTHEGGSIWLNILKSPGSSNRDVAYHNVLPARRGFRTALTAASAHSTALLKRRCLLCVFFADQGFARCGTMDVLLYNHIGHTSYELSSAGIQKCNVVQLLQLLYKTCFLSSLHCSILFLNV